MLALRAPLSWTASHCAGRAPVLDARDCPARPREAAGGHWRRAGLPGRRAGPAAPQL